MYTEEKTPDEKICFFFPNHTCFNQVDAQFGEENQSERFGDISSRRGGNTRVTFYSFFFFFKLAGTFFYLADFC